MKISKTSLSMRPRERFDFVLLRNFSMLSLTAALETLQNANLCASTELYEWQLVGETSASVISSLGLDSTVDTCLGKVIDPTAIVVVGGTDIQRVISKRLLAWLSRHARGKTRVFGLCTGAFVLVKAGIMKGQPATLHWQYRDCFVEAFPFNPLSNLTHEIAENRGSSSGGVSAIDLVLDIIAQDHGAMFADQVAESMNYTMIRELQRGTFADVPAHLRTQHPKLAKTLLTMERNLETPLRPAELAERVSISGRQLERLFNSRFGVSPKKFYIRLRLRRAYFLLIQTDLDIISVAIACGFHSPSHFSKCFKMEFERTPLQLRRER